MSGAAGEWLTRQGNVSGRHSSGDKKGGAGSAWSAWVHARRVIGRHHDHHLHPNGVNVCRADGSVRFISDFIELGTNGTAPGCLGVWDKLNLSNDGLPIDASKF
jgi:prepilin-type processing-associated H-X9-DG protein